MYLPRMKNLTEHISQRQKKEQIVEEDKKSANDLEAQKKDKNYTGKNSYSFAEDAYSADSENLSFNKLTEVSDDDTFAEYLVELEQLQKAYTDIKNGSDAYNISLEEVTSRISDVNGRLKDQVAQLQQDKLWYEETGETGTEGYKEICKQLEIYKCLLHHHIYMVQHHQTMSFYHCYHHQTMVGNSQHQHIHIFLYTQPLGTFQ